MTDRELLAIFEKYAPQHGNPEDINNAIEALRARLAQPEPVAVWELQEGGWDTIADADWMETLPVGTKLYTTPPKKEWVGLTHEEQEELSHSFREIINSIDWKLKKKNGGSHD